MSRLENSDISHKMDVAGDAGDIDAGDTAGGGIHDTHRDDLF